MRAELHRFIIVTHEYTTGAPQRLDEYLSQHAKSVTFIGHPLRFAKDRRSHTHVSSPGSHGPEIYSPYTFRSEALVLCKDIILTVWWGMMSGKKDVYIGVDSVNAVIGLLFRKLGLVQRVVYFSIDYVPNRFASQFLNRFYLWLDQVAVKNCDVVWNMSMQTVVERENHGLSKVYRAKQIHVPMGTEGRIRPVPFAHVKRYHVVHMGHIVPKHGVRLFVEAMPYLRKKLPNIHADILGGGDEEPQLKLISKKLGVSSYITFHGYIPDHNVLMRKLAFCAVGVAPYAPDSDIENGDSGKIKAYLDVGLPVVLTKSPAISHELVKEHAGVVVAYDAKSLASGILAILSNERSLRTYRDNALRVGKRYRWNNIFSGALNAIDLS